MEIKLHDACIPCLLRAALEAVQGEPDGRKRSEYMQRCCAILAEAKPEHDSAPLLDARMARLRREMLGIREDYREQKRRFNALFLGLYAELRRRVWAAADPLMAALQLSIAGNYVDFKLLGEIKPAEALRQIDEAAEHVLNPNEVELLRDDLKGAQSLVLVHDNCGEVVLDKLLLETMRALFPRLRCTSLLRCGLVANDANLEDAAYVRLGEVAELLDNGTPELPGTQIDLLPEVVRRRLEGADVILAKGQGNFESMMGCGLNVYYLLLSKCAHYGEWFGFPPMSAVLANEKRRSRSGGDSAV